jgi:hypothetical protein
MLSDTKIKILSRLLYIVTALLALFYIVHFVLSLKGGFIAGADWNVPSTVQQYSRMLELYSSTWTDTFYLGSRISIHSQTWFVYLLNLFSHVVSDLTLVPILVLIAIQVSAVITTYLFLRELRIRRFYALLSGISLAASPIFFNYMAMGWFYVLLDFSLLNIVLILVTKSLSERKLILSCLAGVFYGLAYVQPQAMLWMPLIFVSFILFGNFNNAGIKRKGLAVTLIIVVGLLINGPIVVPNIFTPDTLLLDKNVVKAGVSISASGLATPSNTIRLLGSLYNSMYESSQSGFLFTVTSFILPLLIITLLKNYRRKDGYLVISFFILFIFPVIVYLLGTNRDLMVKIPGSAIFRDLARFTFVSTYSAAILLGFFLEYLSEDRNRNAVLLRVMFVAWFVIQLRPWIAGDLTKQPPNAGQDIRLRTIKYPDDYLTLEKMLEKEEKTWRIINFPIGDRLVIKNNPNFDGMYKEMWDSNSRYSPLPGVISITGRPVGPSSKVYDDIQAQLKPDVVSKLDIEELLKITSTKFIVVKTDVDFEYKDALLAYLTRLTDSGKIEPYFVSKNIRAYKILNTYPFLRLSESSKNNNPSAELKFNKISPTKYGLQISNVDRPVSIIFSDSYDKYWQLTDDKKDFIGNFISRDLNKYYQHVMVNEYSNGWNINLPDLCSEEDVCTKNSSGTYDLDLTLEYSPQKFFNLGLVTSSITFFTVISLFIISLIKGPRSTKSKDAASDVDKQPKENLIPASEFGQEYIAYRQYIYISAVVLLILCLTSLLIDSKESAEFTAFLCYISLAGGALGDIVYGKYIFQQ